jgi:hypothetical protein
MQLTDLPVGASFLFTEGSLALIEESSKRYNGAYGGPSANPYRLTNNPALPFVLSSLATPLTFPQFVKGGTSQPVILHGDKLEVDLVDSAPRMLFDKSGQLPGREVFTTSCDPEVFLVDEQDNIVPAFSVLPKRKSPPADAYGLFHEDGFQAEFSPKPEHCHERVVSNANYTMQHMLNWAMGNSTKRLRFSPLNFVEIPKAMLDVATDEQASLGCEPSENIYGTKPFTADNPREFPYRMAGGHIHMGSVDIAKWLHSRAEPIITAMDAFVGVGSVALFEGMEDPRRRMYYGRAGEFRFQPHGLEYRTLSNAWLVNAPIAHLILNLARGAFRMGFMEWREVLKLDTARIKAIIDTYDVPEARKFIEENVAAFSWLLNKDSGYSWATKALKLMHQGLPSALPNWRTEFGHWPHRNSFESGKGEFKYARLKVTPIRASVSEAVS